jgi:hypothetical protein
MSPEEKIYYTVQEEFLRILNQECERSDIEIERVKKFSVDKNDDEEGRNKDLRNWSVTALSTRRLLMDDYRNGDIDLKEMLETMRNHSMGLSASQRLFLLGSVAEFGLKTRPKEKANAGKRGIKNSHENPPWFKRTVVDVFDQIKSDHPEVRYFPVNKRSDESIFKRTAEFLAPLQMHLPEWKTVEAWLSEPQNQDVQEYRLMKKTRRPE